MQEIVRNAGLNETRSEQPGRVRSDHVCELGLGLLLFGAVAAMSVQGWSLFCLAAPVGLLLMVVSAVRER